MKNKRFYCFTVIIYEDDVNFESQFSSLLDYKECIYIRHDKDLDEEGNLKKVHFHFVVKLKNACTISALAKKIGVNDNMIEPIKKSLNSALKYLIHYGYDNKFQYSPDEVISQDDKLYNKFLGLVSEDVTESEKVETIEDFILNFSEDTFIEWHLLGRYVRSINMWDAFRRNAWYFSKLVDSHNNRVSELNSYRDKFRN